MARPQNDGQNLSLTIAEFIAKPPALSAGTLDKAKKVVVDTLSANIAGASSDVLPVLAKYLGQDGGRHLVLGTCLRTTAENAALANGTMSAALEFDDVLSIMPGHPSAVVMAALCACDEALASSGAEIIESYAVGIQAGARIAQAMTLEHYKKGFHATGTIALFSAVASLARIARLDMATTQRAIGVAASFSGGLHGNFGTMTKPLHSGWAARNALAAVALARAGLTSSERIFETEGGFFDAYGSPDTIALQIFYGAIVLAFFLGGLTNYFARRPFVPNATLYLVGLITLAFIIINFVNKDGEFQKFGTGTDWRLIPAALLIMLALWLLAAIALACSTRLDMIPTLAICTAVFLIGLMSDYLFGRALEPGVKTTGFWQTIGLWISSGLYTIIPNWQLFWLSDALEKGRTIPWSYVGKALAYVAGYLGAALIAAMLLFEERELS